MAGARALLFATILGGAGGVLFLALVLRPGTAAEGRVRAAVSLFAAVGVGAALLAIGVQGGLLVNGPASSFGSAEIWRIGAGSSYGRTALAALIGLALIASWHPRESTVAPAIGRRGWRRPRPDQFRPERACRGFSTALGDLAQPACTHLCGGLLGRLAGTSRAGHRQPRRCRTRDDQAFFQACGRRCGSARGRRRHHRRATGPIAGGAGHHRLWPCVEPQALPCCRPDRAGRRKQAAADPGLRARRGERTEGTSADDRRGNRPGRWAC